MKSSSPERILPLAKLEKLNYPEDRLFYFLSQDYESVICSALRRLLLHSENRSSEITGERFQVLGFWSELILTAVLSLMLLCVHYPLHSAAQQLYSSSHCTEEPIPSGTLGQ